MSGTAVDNILQRLRRHESAQSSEASARFLVTKLSWRGNYRRILAITPTGIVTQHPESLSITNAWSFTGDHDLAAIEVGGDHADGGTLVLHFRKDKKGLKSRDAKFACKDRAALLEALYRAVAAATIRGSSGLGPSLLGPPDLFSAYKLRRGEWRAVQLRVTATAVERIDPASGTVKWRWRYSTAASPAARLLAPGDAPPGYAPFALFGKVGRSPRVYACRDADGLLRAVQTAALRKLGLELAVDVSGGGAVSGSQLLSMVAAAERERATTPEEAPLGEWEVLRVRDMHAMGEMPAGDPTVSAVVGTGRLSGGDAAMVVPRRLVLTPNGILERRPATYEVAEWRHLPSVAALVRYAEDPQWLGVEWCDGAPTSIYITPARDTVVAALLYAVQNAAGRPVPVLSGPTGGGDPIVAQKGQAPGAQAVLLDPEIERAMVAQLATAAAEFIEAGGPELSLNSLALAGLTAATTTAMAPVPGAGEGEGARTGSEDKDGLAMRAIAGLEQRIRQFNASVAYSGVPPGTRVDEAVVTALLSYLPRQAAAGNQPTLGIDEARLVIMALHTLQALATSPPIASQIVGTAGGSGRIFSSLLSRHDHVAFEAARLLLRLFSPGAGRPVSPTWVGAAPGSPTAGSSHEAISSARGAKSVCFISNARCTSLVAPLRQRRGASPLVAGAIIETVVAVSCNPGARTTELSTREALLQEVAGLGRPMFALFAHPARQVGDATALVMRTIADGGAGAAAPMREAALAEGAVLHHLLKALGPSGERAKLSRDLVAVWADAHEPTLSLLRRVFPSGLMRYLDEPKKKPPPPKLLDLSGRADRGIRNPLERSATERLAEVHHAAERPLSAPTVQIGGRDEPLSAAPSSSSILERLAHGVGSGVVDRLPSNLDASLNGASSGGALNDGERDERDGPSTSSLGQLPRIPERFLAGKARSVTSAQLRGNWEAFWAQVDRDHSHAALVWNERTRAELREALQAEESVLRLGRQRVLDSGETLPVWNAADFSVTYPSLASHLAVGGVYLKLLLDGADGTGVQKLPDPKDFFTAAHLHFLRLGDVGLASSSGAKARAAWSGDSALERELCARAMAVTYVVHAATIGPFVEGMSHIVHILDATPSRSLRLHLLELVHALIVPQGALGGDGGSDNAVRQAAQANAAALVAAGGVEVLVDMIAAAHETSERPAAALQSNLISSAPHAEEVHVWYYLPVAAGPLPTGGMAAVQAFFDEKKAGPVSKPEIRQLAARGEVTGSTLFWTQGMTEPAELAATRELRWWTARGQSHLTPFQAAEIALRTLSAILALRPAVDGKGEGVIPLPPAHAQLASARCLPHLAQVMLTGEPSLVAEACTLLLAVVQHNADALCTLYRTGVYFFVLAYCGSNLQEAAHLLHATHLRQHFRGAAETNPTVPLAQRSILGALLPESLLFSLESYGPGAFAAALTGDSDTPEVIWTHRMRGQRLVPQMLHHIGDLTRRLAQHCLATYDYTPCPPVGYPEIQQEMWCHRYYLRHLCDDVRFPDWPLVEHVQLLQSILGAWREELARKPLGLSAVEAARVLGLDPDAPEGITEETTKAAYRRLARKYHPDRNPAGRDRFEAVQKAYERLQAGGEAAQGGPQPWRILLLLRAQCILYKRYTSELESFKYAGYPLLLTALQAPEGEGAPHFLSSEVAPFLQTAAELCWLTCAASKLNGEELTRSGGVALIGALLTRCMSVVAVDAPPEDPAALLATQALRAFACMAAFPTARADIEGQETLLSDALRACALTRAPSATDAALQCVVQFSRSAALQQALLRRGALGYLIPLLLKFDSTIAADVAALASPQKQRQGNSTRSTTSTDTTPAVPEIFDPGQDSTRGPEFLGLGVRWTNMQAARNHHAALAVRALAALAGMGGAGPETPVCMKAQAALSALLTPTLAPRLGEADPQPLLKDLNSTVASPHVIWNAALREELLSEAETLRERPGEATVTAAAGFRYPSLSEELVVAGVYVRMFCEQPTFPVKDPASLCKGLVTQIHALQHPEKGPEGRRAGEDSAAVEALRRRHLGQCLTALQHVLEATPKLMGLLATRPALDPLLSCIKPACALGDAGPLWPAFKLPESGPNATPSSIPGLPGERLTEAFGSTEAAMDGIEAAAAALGIMLKLSAHAGCLTAMADQRTVLQALWIVHRPPRPRDLLLALKLLHALAGTDAAAWAAAAQGGVVYLMTALLPEHRSSEEDVRATQDAAAVAAAGLLGRLAMHPLHGPRVVLWLGKLLPPGLVAAVQDGPPESSVMALSQSSETPERLWTLGMRQALAEEVSHLATSARTAQATAARTRASLDWTPGEGYAMKYEGLRDEMFVGGVYVKLFLKSPGHPLRHPQAFLEGLLERYTAEVQKPAPDVNTAMLLSAAAVAAMHHHPLLAEHGVALGYVSKLLRVLDTRVPKASNGAAAQRHAAIQPADDISGCALRLLHALCAAPSAGEALARSTPPAVPVLVGAIHWGGAATVLAVETLKRGLSATNRSRDLLVGAALHAGLLQMLLDRLDWRAKPAAATDAPDEASDEGVQRVLFVDVVNLLAMEGSYADQVRAILDDSEVWAAYRGQRHDLFLPAGGSGTNGVVALLKGSEVTRFALPAPEPPAPIAETSHQVRAEVPPVVEAGMPLSEVVQPPAEVKKEVPVEVPAAAAAPANEPVEVEKATEPLVNEGMTATFTPAAERMIDNPLDMPPVAAASPPVSRAKQPDAPMLPPAAIAPPPAPTNPLPAQAVGKTATSVAESRVVSFEQKTPPASPKPSPPPPQRQQVQRAPATVESPRPTPPRQETLSPTKATSDPLSALLGPSDPDESG